MVLPRFQKLLRQFEGNFEFIRLKNKHKLDHDVFAYEIETNGSDLLVFEIDYAYSLANILELASSIGTYRQFIKVKNEVTFEDSSPVRSALKYEMPEDWDTVKQFANDRFGSSHIYFNFLLR